MTQALQISGNGGLDISRMGEVFAKSGYFSDARDAAQAIVKIMAGQELGLPPIASMTGIHVISGRITLGANLIASLIKKSGRYNYRVLQQTDKICEIKFFEGAEGIGVSAFTIEDARKAGTKNLEKFPRNMLFARAISNGARWYCPDIFGGPIYTPDELGAEVNEDGTIVSALPALPPAPKTAAATSVPHFPDRDPKRVQAVKEICSRLNAAGDVPPIEGAKAGDWKPATLDAYAHQQLNAPFAALDDGQLAALGDRLLGRLRAAELVPAAEKALAHNGIDQTAFWAYIAAEFDGRELADLTADEIALVLAAANDDGTLPAF